jgi:hypothetical protein
MARKQRNYGDEYRRRIENAKRIAKDLGVPFSKRQARGHPGEGEALFSSLTKERRTVATERRFENAIRLIRDENLSLAKAAKRAGTTPRTIKKLNARFDLFEQNERRRVKLKLPRALILTQGGQFRYIEMLDRSELSLLARYWNAVKRARRTGDSAALKEFEGLSVTDADGQRHPLVTDLRLINKAYKSLPEEKVSRYSERFYAEVGE